MVIVGHGWSAGHVGGGMDIGEGGGAAAAGALVPQLQVSDAEPVCTSEPSQPAE